MITPRVTDAILSLLADTVSDDPTLDNLRTALISPDGRELVATDGASLVKINLSEGLTTALVGDRLDPDAARKLLKAGKYPERAASDAAFPEFARVIPAIAPDTSNADGRYDANTAPSCGLDAALLARVLSGIAKVSKACGSRLAGVTLRHSSDGLTPMRVDAKFHDGAVDVEIVAVVMPAL